MNQYEVPTLIADQFPDIHKELRHLSVLGNVYGAMNILTTYTRQQIAARQYRQVRNCMKLADRIYGNGNAIVKNAVENIFIYSFSVMRASCNPVEWRLIQSTIPSRLFLLYIHQVTHSSN